MKTISLGLVEESLGQVGILHCMAPHIFIFRESLWGPAPAHQFEEGPVHIFVPQAVDDRVEEGCGNVVENGHFLATI